MTNNIKPCPLCNKEPEVSDASVECKKCALYIEHERDIVIETWNNQEGIQKYTEDELKSLDILPCPFCGRNDQFDLRFFKTLALENRRVRGCIVCACGMHWWDDYYRPAQFDSHHKLTTEQTEKEIIKEWNKKVYDYWIYKTTIL